MRKMWPFAFCEIVCGLVVVRVAKLCTQITVACDKYMSMCKRNVDEN